MYMYMYMYMWLVDDIQKVHIKINIRNSEKCTNLIL